MPKDEIACLVAQLRDDGYQMLRNISSAATLSVADLTPIYTISRLRRWLYPQTRGWSENRWQKLIC